jgi:uncharacterized membrane protein YfcA
MLDPVSIAAIAAAFLLAGTVKGVIGLGLPTVSLGLLTSRFEVRKHPVHAPPCQWPRMELSMHRPIIVQ